MWNLLIQVTIRILDAVGEYISHKDVNNRNNWFNN